jgi:K+-transporting ATPase ATPase C chain
MKTLRTSIALLVAFTVITGILYPLLITAISQMAFPNQANGSLISDKGKAVGSELIGQPFSRSDYFWGRPSSTSPIGYNGGASSGSNLGPLSSALLDSVRQRAARLRGPDSTSVRPIPVDLVTSSASGLDPHISVASALVQVPRIARARALSENEVRELVNRNTQGRQWGFLGEPRVNVLRLNMELDGTTQKQVAR